MVNLSPKLRFPEFNDFWKSKKLEDVGSVINGLTYSPDNIHEDGVLVLRSSNVKENQLSFKDNVYVNTDNYNAVKENDILICVRNGSRNLIGKNALITKEVEGVAFGAFMSVYRSELNKFVFQLFATDTYYKIIQENLGATINSINNSDLKKFEFYFPLKEEQDKIANFLNSVDNKINKLTKKKVLLEQYKKGIMQKIFNQEIRFKDNNGNDYPIWVESKLENIASIVTGKTPDTSNLNLWNGTVQFITPTDIKDGFKYQESTERYVSEFKNIKLLPKNSIVYTCIASIGKMCITKYPSITNQQINSLIINDVDNFEYVYYWLLYITPFIKSTQSNTTLPIINKTDFSKFKILLPCIKEQNQIANFLMSIDSKIDNVNILLEGTKKFKKGILQEMFI